MSQSKSEHGVRRWWLPAQEDLEVAKTLHEAGKFSHACFLAQQSDEKAVKALWLSIDLCTNTLSKQLARPNARPGLHFAGFDGSNRKSRFFLVETRKLMER